jgi:ribosomal peptide maturation radical SAM protein 1
MGRRTVLLIAMPWAQLEYPSIQLGTLKAVLERSKIRTETRSFFLTFAEHLVSSTGGVPEEECVSIADYGEVASRSFLGDWIFSVPPFHDNREGDEHCFAYLRSRETPETLLRKALLMRQQVPAFLEACLEDILAAAPDAVGFTTTFGQNVSSLVLAKLLKARAPSLPIVFGGANCDGQMGAALHRSFPWVDAVVRGEGERVAPELFRDLLARKPIRPQPGLCYRQGGQDFIIDQSPEALVSMDEVPMPDYDEYFERVQQSPLRSPISPTISIPFEAARGCWWGAKSHCTFCGLNGSAMAFRSKSSARAAEELTILARKHKRLAFQAVDNIIDLKYFKDFLPRLRDSGFDFQLFYEVKANLKKEQIRAMRDAGVTSIQPGIESLSTPILKSIGKGVTALQNIRTLKWCAELGIQVFWNLLYGFPNEPPEEYDRMADVMRSLTHLEPPSLILLDVERFSPYYERPEDFGLEIAGPLPPYRFIYPDGVQLADLAYSFEYRYLDGRRPETYVQAVRNAVADWRSSAATAFGSLGYRRGPGFLLIQDRRPNLEPAEYSMGEREAWIYLACEGGSTPEMIRDALLTHNAAGLEVRAIADFLEEMREARLVYEEDGRYLALALPMQREGRAKSDAG